MAISLVQTVLGSGITTTTSRSASITTSAGRASSRRSAAARRPSPRRSRTPRGTRGRRAPQCPTWRRGQPVRVDLLLPERGSGHLRHDHRGDLDRAGARRGRGSGVGGSATPHRRTTTATWKFRDRRRRRRDHGLYGLDWRHHPAGDGEPAERRHLHGSVAVHGVDGVPGVCVRDRCPSGGSRGPRWQNPSASFGVSTLVLSRRSRRRSPGPSKFCRDEVGHG